jgi:tetratricopeptide (TPR) repeat protein
MLSAIADLLLQIPNFDWLPPVIVHRWNLTLGRKVFEIGKLILEIAGAWELFYRRLYSWIMRRRHTPELKNEVLEHEAAQKKQEIAKLRADLKQRTEELAHAQDRLPEAAMAKAEREWRDRNKDLALRHLEEWFTANAESIGTVATRLAEHHLAHVIPIPGDHLTRAAAMIRIARGATLDSPETRELSIQFDLINGELQQQLIRDGDTRIAWNDNVGREPGGLSLIRTLHDVAQYCYVRGHWRLAPIFADRASDLAARGGLQMRKTWCEIESLAAFYKGANGHYTEALERLDAVLTRAAEAAYADRDPVVLTTRYYRAQTLANLGRYADGLTEIDALAPIRAEVLGGSHPHTLVTRYDRAQTLSGLGLYAEALSEIDAFLPIQTEVLGPAHPGHTLQARSLRAATLSNLGRHAEALSEIDAFAPIQAGVLGARHPNTLATRFLRAQTLSELGHYTEALSAIDALAPIQAEELGTRHPGTLTTRYLRAMILSNLGQCAEALSPIDAFLPIQTNVFGPAHPDHTLRGRWLRALTLSRLGRHAEALAEIAAYMPIEAAALGAEHLNVLLTDTLRQEIHTRANIGSPNHGRCQTTASRGKPAPVGRLHRASRFTQSGFWNLRSLDQILPKKKGI